jgi:hypothetical protein
MLLDCLFEANRRGIESHSVYSRNFLSQIAGVEYFLATVCGEAQMRLAQCSLTGCMGLAGKKLLYQQRWHTIANEAPGYADFLWQVIPTWKRLNPSDRFNS